jgi:hypothetical protein
MNRLKEQRSASALWLAGLPLLSLTGCAQEQAAVFGKFLFGLMIVVLVVGPVVFWREWNRRGRP